MLNKFSKHKSINKKGGTKDKKTKKKSKDNLSNKGKSSYFEIDGDTLSDEEVGKEILENIKKVADVPAEAEYKSGKDVIRFTNFGSLKNRSEIIQSMMDAKIASKGSVKRLGLFDRATTNFYRKPKNCKSKPKSIEIVLEQGKGTMANIGEQAENIAESSMNLFFENNNLDDTYQAEAMGGSGKGDDVQVRNIKSGKIYNSFEIKSSKGTRLDFGQMRISYNGSEWIQETQKTNKSLVKAFKILKSHLDKKITPNYGELPSGPGLTEEQAYQFWNSYCPEHLENKSICGDVTSVEIPPHIIQEYYALKGNDYIIMDNDIYSLQGAKGLLPLSEALQGCYVMFRIKYHSADHYSYTVTLRMNGCLGNHQTDFNTAIRKIFL